MIVLGFQVLTFSGCTTKDTFWIYSSIRHSSEEQLKEALAKEFPGVQVRWYLAGSEKIAQTLDAERATSSEQADLVISADPFWYFAKKKAGFFQAYNSPANQTKLGPLNDPGHEFAAIRLMSVVIAYNPSKLSEADAPHSWKELLLPKWKKKVAIPNPLESGTTFAFIALLTRLYGQDYVDGLQRNEVEVGTTSDTVLARIEAGDRSVGVLLAEDALRAKKKGLAVLSIYPTDGAIAVPGYIAILKTTKSPALARKIYDFFFSPAVQTIFLENGMHSPLHPEVAPAGAKPWEQIHFVNGDWSGGWVAEVVSARDATKKKFAEMFLKR